jgi:hypothetical protein
VTAGGGRITSSRTALAAAGRDAATAVCATSRIAVLPHGAVSTVTRRSPATARPGSASSASRTGNSRRRARRRVVGGPGAGGGDRRVVRAPRPLRPVDGGDHLPRGPRGARALAENARIAHDRFDRHRRVVRRDPRVDRPGLGAPWRVRGCSRCGDLGRLRDRRPDTVPRAGAAPPAGAGLVADTSSCPSGSGSSPVSGSGS